MAKFGVNIIGANRLKRSMRQAGISLSELKAANKAAATVVAAAGKARAPIGKPTRRGGRGRRKAGGALMKSIRAGASQKAGVVKAGSARVPYANPIHWGWPKRHIKPNYFLSEAAIATESIWVKNYERHINNILRKVD